METQTTTEEQQDLNESQDVVQEQEIIAQDEEVIQEQIIPDVLRTPKNGCFEYYTGGWGRYIRSIEDPDANVIIGHDDLKKFELKENIHKIPAVLWQRWVQLCFHFVEKVPSELEVSVRILRNEADPSKYRILVPRQKVSAASVRAKSFHDAIDISTGEVITSYPPIGWIPVGSTHSHNTMPSFFSSTDDEYELGDPGIHLVVGDIDLKRRSYTIACSVVGSGRRFDVPYQEIIDASPIEGVTFNKDVLSFVEIEVPKVFQASKFTKPFNLHKQPNNYNQTNQNKNNKSGIGYNDNTQNNNQFDYKDPFGFQDIVNFGSDDSLTEFWEQYGEQVNKEGDDVELWNVEDIIEDYIKGNRGDQEKIQELVSLLSIYVEEYNTVKQ